MSKAKNYLSATVILFMLVGLPAISYVYLKRGYEFRKEAILTQGDFGKLPASIYEQTPVRGTLPDGLRGAMSVVGWLDPGQEAVSERYGTMLDSLYIQFANSPNLYFTTFVKGEDAAAAAQTFADRHNLPEDEMISFLAVDDDYFVQSAREFQLPTTPGTAPYVALVDSSLTIVKHYDLASRDENIGLVQLISVIIPLPEKPDVVVKRAREL